ncbi:hypothetical protein HanIR_Chr15g0748231 [Helianthus annuus]|nr:hypothetical protein HanIR_Chr15g0748231 [Helianthus annuus]
MLMCNFPLKFEEICGELKVEDECVMCMNIYRGGKTEENALWRDCHAENYGRLHLIFY